MASNLMKDKKLLAFYRQRCQAKARQEPWNMTYEQWYAIWDGNWDKRGRHKGAWRMRRIDYNLPWQPDNIQLIANKFKLPAAPWKRGTRKDATQCEIDGKHYESVLIAAKELDIKPGAVYYKLNSVNYPNWIRLRPKRRRKDEVQHYYPPTKHKQES